MIRTPDAVRRRPLAGIARRLTDVATDLRYALRSWTRQPGFVLVAVLSLACGIGLNTAVFSIINAIFLQGIRGVPAPERIITVGQRVPFTTFREVRDGGVTLEAVAAWQPIGVEIRFRDSVLRRVVPVVSDGYFATLGVAPARGRFFAPSRSREPLAASEVVLDYEFWMTTMAGDPAVIGESIVVNRVPATILGIAPRAFHGFGPERPPLWIPMGMLPAVRGSVARWEDPAESGWRIFGRLPADASVGQVNAELRTLATRSPALFPGGPLRGANGGGEGWSGPVSAEKRIEFLLVVVVPLVIAGLILWIGCSNVANLLLARAASRRKEIAIRLASGASRSRVVSLLLTESLLLAFAGGMLGLLLAFWTLDMVWLTLPESPKLAVEIDTRVLLYTSAVCVGATLLFGLVPALHATRVDVAPLLKGETPAPDSDVRRSTRVRRFFLITQFASSMALLVVAGTFVRAIVATHVGERSALMDHIAVAAVETDRATGAARVAHWRSVREDVLRVAGVSSVTLMSQEAGGRAQLVPEGAAPSTAPGEVHVQSIDPAFFGTSSLLIVAGRGDVSDLPQHGLEKAVVNERAARQFWGGTGVLGRRFSLRDTAFEIVGLVRDDGSEPRVFRALREEGVRTANVMIRTAQPSDRLIQPLRSALAGPTGERAVVRVSTLRDASIGPLARITWMAVTIATLVLSLAVVGLYGAISFVTAQRTREIAIRMAVGATAPAVLRLVAREGVLVLAAGSALGLLLIGVAFRFMSGMIFAAWTLEPVTIAGVLTVFSLATVGACYLPARRATRLDPMRVLRSE